MLESSPNYAMPLPNKTDEEIDVADSLASGLTIIDTELKNRKNELDTHKTASGAHDSVNIKHGDGNVRDTLFEVNSRLTTAETDIEDVDSRISTIVAQAGTDNTEIVDARGEFTTLHDRFEYFANKQKNTWVDVVEDYKVPINTLSNAGALIQQAINECAPLGVWVIVPKGIYMLETSLVAKTGLKMIVHKDAELQRYHNGCLLLNGATGDLTGASDVRIDGGKWNLRGDIINDDGSAFAFGYASSITVRNAKVYNVNYSHGIELAAIDGADIEYCEFYGFIDNTGTRSYAEAIQPENGTTAGFPYFGSNNNAISKNIRVKQCKVGPSDAAGSWGVGVGNHSTPSIPSVDNLQIINCNFLSAVDTGIVANGITNLKIEKTKIQAKNGVKIAHSTSLVTDAVLRDNEIKATLGVAVLLDDVDTVLIEHNVIDGWTYGVMGLSAKSVEITKKNTISGQTVDAVSFAETCTGLISEGNIIKKAGRNGINMYDNSTHARIRDNRIIDVVNNAFNFQGTNTKGIICEGNTVLDTTLNRVLYATAGVDSLFFNKNFYPSSIVTPIESTASNSDVTGNKTY